MAKLKDTAIWSDNYRPISWTRKLSDSYFKYHSPLTYRPSGNKYNIVSTSEGDRVEECREVVVHSFSMGDVEDPDLYAAHPLSEWEKSEVGQWVMKNAADVPTWHRMADTISYGYQYQIRAKLQGAILTEWILRHGK